MKKYNGKLRDVRSKDLLLLKNNPDKFWKDVSVIDNGAFKYLSKLTEIEIPASVKVIESNAFYCCENLQHIELHNGLEAIGGCVFLGCSSLQSLRFPQTVKTIGSNAFYDCVSLETVDLPEGIEEIGWNMFCGCESLKEITIPQNVRNIGVDAFKNCSSLKRIEIPQNVSVIGNGALDVGGDGLDEFHIKSDTLFLDYSSYTNMFASNKFSCAYMSKDGAEIIFSKHNQDEKYLNNYLKLEIAPNDLTAIDLLLNPNYRKNKLQVEQWKENGKIKFIPPEYTLKVFPSVQFEKYFLNNNHIRYGKLVKTLGFDKLQGNEKFNSLTDLMKIYYAIGGFSENQGESEKAFDYLLKHVVRFDNLKPEEKTPEKIGEFIHSKFSGLNLSGEYNKTFAKFFMKYYKDNPNFMVFSYLDDDNMRETRDFLCSAHNNFQFLLKSYPNMVVNGNEEKSLLTPRFVAEHSRYVEYNNVRYGNQELANVVGRYGYSQSQFEYMQNIFERAKKIEFERTLKIYESNENDAVRFKLLDKDDPLGFVLGNITNCCQCINEAGASCVVDGYTNADSGFLVFETDELDANGNKTGASRIIGQAYVWYDPKTKTVCLDNIEIPTKVLKELRTGENKKSNVTISKF